MKELMTGNEAIARGTWEAGAKFASAYPGTPSTEILENISAYPEIISEWAPNEKVAAEASIGASIAGVRALTCMKHVGVNVAADPLFTFAYTGVGGGFVVVSADDPGMHSSQNEQDNRNYAKHMKIAMMEPSDSQECLDMMADAFAVSEKFDVPMMLRVTTRICHSKSMVNLGERSEIPTIEYVKNTDKYDTIPAVSKKRRVVMAEREKRLLEYSENCKWNTVEYNDTKIGIITNGVAYQYAKEVFGENASYCKIGFSWPLPMELIRKFSQKVDKLYVVEELDPFMETEIKANGISCIGKEVIPAIGELNPNIVAKAILGTAAEIIETNPSLVVARPPTLCAGCPHRSFFYELAKRRNTVVAGDIGCYGLGGLPPLSAKDTSICMGASFSVGHGMAKAFALTGQNKRVVATMGDSTFFHTGINSLIEAIYNNSNVICCVLDNRITGMTGHQENPGTGFNIKGEPSALIDVETVVRALGATNVRTINPMDLKIMNDTLDWAYGIKEGPVVIITRWPCVLKKFSKADIAEFDVKKSTCQIDQGKCIGCRQCMNMGCPALRFDKDKKKASIDAAQCVGCDVCAQVCPVKAIEGGKK